MPVLQKQMYGDSVMWSIFHQGQRPNHSSQFTQDLRLNVNSDLRVERLSVYTIIAQGTIFKEKHIYFHIH